MVEEYFLCEDVIQFARTLDSVQRTWVRFLALANIANPLTDMQVTRLTIVLKKKKYEFSKN